MPFTDRTDAGRRLARRLSAYRGDKTVVLGLPRGGVPVAAQVAQALGAPLDIILVRKLGVPYQPELAAGAIGEGGVRVLDREVVRHLQLTGDEIAAVERAERAELRRRAQRFRGDRAPMSLQGRVAIIVDDGVATGSTARAACQVARAHGAARVVLAVPVGSREAIRALRGTADEVVCLETPAWFSAIGEWYDDFAQTTDDEVIRLLSHAAHNGTTADRALSDDEVEVFAGMVPLAGRLSVPDGAKGIVVFAHGSGSSRHSPRNQYVAGVLNRAGLATVLFDLLTHREERDRGCVFDVPMLASRLADVTRWAAAHTGLPVGLFGASTGAAAALWAATDERLGVTAVVSRGGRPDLAAERLPRLRVPTLLIVGGRDEIVLELNEQARALMTCEAKLVVVPGATHLFEEPGALDQAARLARDWLTGHLPHQGGAHEVHRTRDDGAGSDLGTARVRGAV
ncbi:phosphoribosyltransferase [Amycolatopsis sp. K13G38]|uniref:Phosphoribosyltransferase n=1 Tax=Amycolatopsis acididurans TaxID=2724524 RepID=A0ABX1J8X4_9PSEU|nr:alpha/beta family hydrolase [Amycolatopsis acididurans]NKQ56237.1 phosphoribosyltransferase [Amycolatopsis acididurans]